MENLDPIQIALLTLLLLLLLTWIYLLLRRLLEKLTSGVSGQGDAKREDPDEALVEATGEADKTKAKESLARAILKQGDPFLIEQLAKMAGMSHKDLLDRSQDEETVRELARRLDIEDLSMLKIASETEIPVTAKTTKSTERAPYPTDNTDVGRLRDMNDFANLSPEQLADPTLPYQIATGDVPIIEHYQDVVQTALFYMLCDVSGSMEKPGRSGIQKFITARAVACKLLSKAIEGKAKYFLRFFDGNVHDKKTVLTKDEAQKVFNLVSRSGYSGGGTNILHALRIAVRDIKKEDRVEAEIILISDGEDKNVNEADLRSILGDIKLHVILLGGDNAALKAVATSYRYA